VTFHSENGGYVKFHSRVHEVSLREQGVREVSIQEQGVREVSLREHEVREVSLQGCVKFYSQTNRYFKSHSENKGYVDCLKFRNDDLTVWGFKVCPDTSRLLACLSMQHVLPLYAHKISGLHVSKDLHCGLP
jgi:hypothetical protein